MFADHAEERRLVELGRRLSVERSWRRRPDIAAHLDIAGTPVGPSSRYAFDVRTLRRVTDGVLRSLADHARLRVADETVRCERAATDDLLRVDGSVVVVGAPGCGKSGMLHDLACRLDREDVVVLAVDRLAGDAGATRTALDLHHDLVDVFRQWSGTGRATLVLDGLDAARGEATTWLSRLVRELRDTRWRAVASMRRFDLQHSIQWREAFRGRPVAPGGPAEAADLPEVRHYLLGDLTTDEVDTLAQSSAEIRGLLAGASPHLVDLVRNPFNMRLATELLEVGEPAESLATMRDQLQLQLLQRHWQRRVTDGPRSRTRIRALATLVEAMLAARRLSADDGVVSDALCDDVDTLLHDGVLREVPTSLRAQSARTLAFSHHILFDFAAADLAFSATVGSRLGARLRDDPDLAVVARPSIDMHLADLWHDDGKHTRFAAAVDDLVADDHVLAGIAAARVAVENVIRDSDLSWLAERFDGDVAAAATVTSWIGGVMEADPDLVLRDGNRLVAWAALAHRVAAVLDQRYTSHAAWAALQLLGQLDRINALAPGTADAPMRADSTARLMDACLGGGEERGGLAVRVARLLPRAVAVDVVVSDLDVLSAVRRVLSAFARVGWPAAVALSARLSEAFR